MVGVRRYEATVSFPDHRTYSFGLMADADEDKVRFLGVVSDRLVELEEKWLRSVNWVRSSFSRGTDVSADDPPSESAKLRLDLLFQAAKRGEWAEVLELAGDALVELVEFKKKLAAGREWE
jgi:hypothetical protein